MIREYQNQVRAEFFDLPIFPFPFIGATLHYKCGSYPYVYVKAFVVSYWMTDAYHLVDYILSRVQFFVVMNYRTKHTADYFR